MNIEETVVINGFAWIDDETGELVWAYREEFDGVKPSDRPAGATPVIIEITPSDEWVTKQQSGGDKEFLGDLQKQLIYFKDELDKIQRSMRVEAENG